MQAWNQTVKDLDMDLLIVIQKHNGCKSSYIKFHVKLFNTRLSISKALARLFIQCELNKNIFQLKAHLPLAKRKPNTLQFGLAIILTL